jgi:hypothetical protein
MAVALQAENLVAGQTITLETSALPGGALQLVGVEGSAGGGRFLPITGARSDAGATLTATATGGAMGISRTAGTSLRLVGETTSGSAVTDKAMWEFDLPDSYVAGSSVAVVVNAAISGGGTITAASCTMALAAYSEINGVEAALTVTGGTQQITAAGANINWTVAGTGLVVGSHLVFELTMLITSASGSNTGQVNSISFLA